MAQEGAESAKIRARRSFHHHLAQGPKIGSRKEEHSRRYTLGSLASAVLYAVFHVCVLLVLLPSPLLQRLPPIAPRGI